MIMLRLLFVSLLLLHSLRLTLLTSPPTSPPRRRRRRTCDATNTLPQFDEDNSRRSLDEWLALDRQTLQLIANYNNIPIGANTDALAMTLHAFFQHNSPSPAPALPPASTHLSPFSSSSTTPRVPTSTVTRSMGPPRLPTTCPIPTVSASHTPTSQSLFLSSASSHDHTLSFAGSRAASSPHPLAALAATSHQVRFAQPPVTPHSLQQSRRPLTATTAIRSRSELTHPHASPAHVAPPHPVAPPHSVPPPHSAPAAPTVLHDHFSSQFDDIRSMITQLHQSHHQQIQSLRTDLTSLRQSQPVHSQSPQASPADRFHAHAPHTAGSPHISHLAHQPVAALPQCVAPPPDSVSPPPVPPSDAVSDLLLGAPPLSYDDSSYAVPPVTTATIEAIRAGPPLPHHQPRRRRTSDTYSARHLDDLTASSLRYLHQSIAPSSHSTYSSGWSSFTSFCSS